MCKNVVIAQQVREQALVGSEKEEQQIIIHFKR